jgi:DNA-binding NtrC family response regulator
LPPMDQYAQASFRYTVLVVDDDSVLRNLVARLLVDSQYTVLTAANGAEALRRSRDCQTEIHLLLSDFQMPGVSGVELATQIAKERPNVRVLLMSGYRGMLVLDQGWHFLAKPFLASQLRTLVADIVTPDRQSRCGELSAVCSGEGREVS